MRSVQSFRGWRRLGAVAGLYLLSLALAHPSYALPSSSAPSAEEVRFAAEALYVHGMTREIAEREVGAAGVPELIRLLWDPEFERRDNVVALLAYLGDAGSVPELLRFLERPPRPPVVPEEDRALLLVPEALGRIAGRTGDENALATLLELTAGEIEREPGLVQMAIRGLMLSGAAEARQRLEDLSLRRIVPPAGFDLAPTAAVYLDRLDRRSGRRSLAPDAGDAVASALPADFDLNPITHDLSIDYANHVNLGAEHRMSDARLDRMLGIATELLGLEDFTEDVACCATITRSAPGKVFGTADDGLDLIDSQEELDSVLANATARFKVVRLIGWCAGGETTNTIGCGYLRGFGVAVVRYGGATREAVLWTHEFGHNLGMKHTPDPRYIMNGSIDAVGGLFSDECQKLHFPDPRAEMTPTVVGTCSDDDRDGRHEVIDNCPQVHNVDQADFDGDAIGDACEQGARLADADGSGTVDGFDLARLGRAFGSRSEDPDYDATVDLDRNGRVDGEDLAILAEYFGAPVE